MAKTLTPEEFETKLRDEFGQLIKSKEKVVALLDEAEQYAREIKFPDNYEQLAIDILSDVRKNRKFFFNQWKSVNLFVINQRKMREQNNDDAYIVL